MALVSRYDCVQCGACCCNLPANRAEGFIDYVEVDARAPLLRRPELVRRLVVYNEDGAAHLRLHPDGRCLALRGRVGQRVRCTIYSGPPRGLPQGRGRERAVPPLSQRPRPARLNAAGSSPTTATPGCRACCCRGPESDGQRTLAVVIVAELWSGGGSGRSSTRRLPGACQRERRYANRNTVCAMLATGAASSAPVRP